MNIQHKAALIEMQDVNLGAVCASDGCLEFG
jgi:hypothetical protein